MPRLTWDDLLVPDIEIEQFREWISPWTGVVTGRLAPAFMSKFGTWFLRRPEGQVEMFDVLTGQIERMADSYDEFMKEVNNQSWQEVYLCSDLIYELHQVTKIPGTAQCYALAPHPALGGQNPMLGDHVAVENVMVMDIMVWQSICAQSLRLGQ